MNDIIQKNILYSIVIPFYNEAERINSIFKELVEVFSVIDYQVEIVFVDDGSTDDSREMVETFIKQTQASIKMQLLSNSQNMGKGSAVRKGMVAAQGQYVLSTDADLSFPLSDIEKYKEILIEHEADVVVGSRYHSSSVHVENAPRYRQFFSFFFRKLVNIIIGVNCSDVNCGYKLFTSDSALRIFSKQQINGWSYDAETFFLIKKYHFKWVEAPVTITDRSGSRVMLFSAICKSMWELFLIRYYNLKNYY